MPELPEVETVRRGLSGLIVGKEITDVDSLWHKSFQVAKQDLQEFVIGANVQAVSRRAKVLLIDLSSEHTLLVHLKMTGQLVYRGEQNFGAGHPNDSLINELPDRSTRVTFTFSDGSKLFFNDQRKFGWIRVFPTIEIPNVDFMKKLGPEPLSADFTQNDFKIRIKLKPNKNIKSVLLDQSIIAGVGNIYADESLWAARIHPETRVKNMSDNKLATLFMELVAVLNLSIEKGGSTDKNYVNAEGKKGSYIEFARVFRREGKSCYRCDSEIIKIRVASRGTHICPKCQRLAK